MSLPAWECGLKSLLHDAIACSNLSLPAWECGLKSKVAHNGKFDIEVTPCVGVWIEIVSIPENSNAFLVTPCVGVWIEIHSQPG